MKSISETHVDTLKLLDYLGQQAAGAELSYLAIHHDSGVAMDAIGRQRLRSALRMARREYSPMRGYGIKLASPDSAVSLISTRMVRIDKAVLRGDRTQRLMHEQFYGQLSSEDQRKVLFAGAVFGAIRLAAEQGRTIQRKAIPGPSPMISIPVPSI